jgi:hypothetical protein
MERVLTAIGLYPLEEIRSIADGILADRSYRDSRGEFRLYAMGDVRDPRLARRHPDVRQLLWNDVLTFVHERLTRHGLVKRDHQQWDDVGWSLYARARELSRDRFVGWGRDSLTDGRGRFLE